MQLELVVLSRLGSAAESSARQLDLTESAPLFCFVGNPVSAIYGLKHFASIFDIKGNRQILKVFVYVLDSTPIPFLLGLTDHEKCFSIFFLPPSTQLSTDGHITRLASFRTTESMICDETGLGIHPL